MGHRYLLVSKSNHNETILSYGRTIESLMSKTKYLSFDYYKPSQFYIRDTENNKLMRLWLSPEFGCKFDEVENEEISPVNTMYYQNGARYMAKS